MKIEDIINGLEELAPPHLQEGYDNAGLITGDASAACLGILCSLDVTEEVILEARDRGCNLVVAHHPIIFSALKKITGKTYVERVIIAAIKNDIAIYAVHTNLDNVMTGVNGKIADKLNLKNRRVLLPKPNTLIKLAVFVPVTNADKVRTALFKAGAGVIGNYSEVSFSAPGTGTFTPNEFANPYLGEQGKKEKVNEEKIEVILPTYLKDRVVSEMIAAHPYEEVAYDLFPVINTTNMIGAGLVGELPDEMEEVSFLQLLQKAFGLAVIKHTPLLKKKVKRIALCGGAGSFLIKNAVNSGADVFVTADLKYHEFFDAEGRIMVADIGHWESEQFTVELLCEVLQLKFATFAVLKSEIKTSPVHYFI